MSPESIRQRRRIFVICTAIAWLLAFLPTLNLWIMSWMAVIVAVSSPLITLLILFRILIFPGAFDGLKKFFFPRLGTTLTNWRFWADAIMLSFYSVDVGTSIVTTVRSRDRLQHRVLLSSTVIVLWDLAFGFLNAMLLFAVRGALELESEAMRTQLKTIDEHDPGALMFVAITSVVRKTPYPKFWSLIYFGTIALNTIASLTVFIITIGLQLSDSVPFFNRRAFHWSTVTVLSPVLALSAVRCTCVLYGVDPTTDLYSDIISLLVLIVSTVVMAVKLNCPVELFLDVVAKLDVGIDFMTRYWLNFSWLAISPIVIIICAVIKWERMSTSAAKHATSGWVGTTFLLIQSAPLLAAVLYVLHVLRRVIRWRQMFRTSDEFGPDPRALQEIRPTATVDSVSAAASRRPTLQHRSPRGTESPISFTPARVIF